MEEDDVEKEEHGDVKEETVMFRWRRMMMMTGFMLRKMRWR